jgi:hypothetical protein
MVLYYVHGTFIHITEDDLGVRKERREEEHA